MARWSFCNVLQWEPEKRHLWQFSADANFKLVRATSEFPDGQVPGKFVGKDWRSLLRPRLNVAWLPPEEVFLRVIQLPASSFQELASMVELQLEKLSPIPVSQAAWSLQVIPNRPGAPADATQTVIVVVVSRNRVEQYLGQLEKNGFFADRLEIQFVDQLMATDVNEDGVWIYPGKGTDQSTFLLAWWYGGILRHLGVVNIPAGDTHGNVLKEQIQHMTWAGEMEGWLSGPPKVHLVADPTMAGLWEPILSHGAESPIQVISPLPEGQLAHLSAQRATENPPEANLVPPEYGSRYHQQYVDRLWMRGVAAAVIIYLLGVAAYLGAVQFLKFQNSNLARELKSIGPQYTNAVQLGEMASLAKVQLSRKTTAMDCLKAVAELLPADFVLLSFSYGEQKSSLLLTGTAPKDQIELPIQFFEELRRSTNSQGRLLFDVKGGEPPAPRNLAGQQDLVQWSMTLEVKY